MKKKEKEKEEKNSFVLSPDALNADVDQFCCDDGGYVLACFSCCCAATALPRTTDH